MTRTTKYLLLMLLTILVGTYFYITCCSECGASVAEEPLQEAIVPITPEPTSYPFAFSDGDYTYNENKNYNFKASSYNIMMPLDASMSSGIVSLTSYISENSGIVFNITGYNKGDETNESAFPNLGLARANAVKNHLVSNGLSSARINTMGKLMEVMVPDDRVYLGPIAYSISGESETAGDELRTLYDKIKVDPLMLYFNTAEASINLSPEQRQKVADLPRYLDKVEGSAGNIVGHTDNTGVAATNMNLGLNRADFATEEGKSKNRWTVVTLN